MVTDAGSISALLMILCTPSRSPSSPHADPSNPRRRTKRRRRRKTIFRRRGSRKPSTETAIKPPTRGAFLDLLTAVLARQIYILVGAVRCGAPAARPARSARLAPPRCRRPWAKFGPNPSPAHARSGDRRKPCPSPGARRPRPLPSGRWHSRGSATRTSPPVVLGAGTVRRRG